MPVSRRGAKAPRVKTSPKRGILARTTDFLRAYLHAQGKSEVPQDYHLWSAISLVAACLADRVRLELPKHSGRYLYPNLYVFLIGDSGSKKSTAIDAALSLAEDHLDTLGVYTGMLTRPALVEHYGCREDDEPKDARVYLVTGELGAQLGDAARADSLLKYMTDYQKAGPRVVPERTVTRGLWLLHNPCHNWLAGSTFEWFVETVSPSAVEGGLNARMTTVLGTHVEERYFEEILPPDYGRVIAWLKRTLDALCEVEGEVTLTKDARAMAYQWYHSGEEPDASVKPWWQRRRDLMLKLAIVFMACEKKGREGMKIERRHVERAIQAVAERQSSVPELVYASSMGSEAKRAWVVEKILERSGKGGILRSELAKRASKRGVTGRDLDLALMSLREQDRLVEESVGNAMVYRLET